MNVLGFDRRDAQTIWNFLKMFVRNRFLGSHLGSIWAIANPLLLFSIYTFVFGFVFKSKLPGSEATLSYVTWLIAGFGFWLGLNEALVSAANSIHGNSGIVKNMAFKIECLPLAATLMGLIPLAVSLAFLLVLLPFDGNPPSWHALVVPFVVLLAFALVAGLGLALAPLVVFFRDVGVALPTLLMMMLFATPIFYPIDAMPGWAQTISHVNPIFILVDWMRQPLIFHRFPNPLSLIWVMLLAAAIWSFSLPAFRRVKGHLHSAL